GSLAVAAFKAQLGAAVLGESHRRPLRAGQRVRDAGVPPGGRQLIGLRFGVERHRDKEALVGVLPAGAGEGAATTTGSQRAGHLRHKVVALVPGRASGTLRPLARYGSCEFSPFRSATDRSATSSIGGSALPRVSARRRIPAHAFALKK